MNTDGVLRNFNIVLVTSSVSVRMVKRGAGNAARTANADCIPQFFLAWLVVACFMRQLFVTSFECKVINKYENSEKHR